MKSIKINYIYSLVYQILAIIAPLITAPYISRVLSVYDIGIYSYTQSIVNNFILFGTIGLMVYGQREIASASVNNNNVNKCFSEIVHLRIILMSISIIIYGFFCIFKGDYSLVYSIELMQLFSSMFDITFLFQGLEEFKKIAIRNTIVKVLNVALIFCLVRKADDLKWYVFCCSIGTVLSCAIIWMCKPKEVKFVKVTATHIFKHLSPALALFIPQVAVEIYTVLDKTMLGLLTEKTESGYYEQANKIVKVLLTIITSLGAVMLSRIAKLLRTNEKEMVNKYIYRSFSFVYCISFPIAVGLALISRKFIPLYFGIGYERSADLVIILCPISVFIGMSSVCGTQYLIPAKRQKDYTINVTTGAIVNLVANIFLITKWGCVGAAFASVIAEFSVLCRHLYSIRKEFSIINILFLSKKYLLSVVVMTVAVFFIGKLPFSNIVCMGLQIIGGALFYGAMLILLKDEIIYAAFLSLKKYLGSRI